MSRILHVDCESDPQGLSQHEPGAKLDLGKPRVGLVMRSFARALYEVAKVGTYGANKYTPHGWELVANGIERYDDALFRHLLKEEFEGEIDEESQLLHKAQAAWNALAELELFLRDNNENNH